MNYFGLLNIDDLGKTIKSNPDKVVNKENYGRNLQIDGKQWEDGSISLSIYNKESKERFNIGKIFKSKFQQDTSNSQ